VIGRHGRSPLRDGAQRETETVGGLVRGVPAGHEPPRLRPNAEVVHAFKIAGGSDEFSGCRERDSNPHALSRNRF
jgi:hypothetical protein